VDTKATAGQENRREEDQIHMSRIIIKLPGGSTGFTDDKDEAKRIRVNTILPSLDQRNRIVLDFTNVKSSTQSFVHALLGEVLQRYGEAALEKIEFRRCNALMKSLVELVVDYSLGGFRSDHPGVSSSEQNSYSGAATREPKAPTHQKRIGINRRKKT
jgi:hypothetical protein